MASRFSVGGRSAATAATQDQGSHLWNPHASISVYVREVWVFTATATAQNLELIRTSTIGTTPGTTVTPDIDNHFARRFAPISAAVLYLSTFATYPVVQGPALARGNLPAALGAGFIWVFSEPIEVPAGTGLAVATATALAMVACDLTYVWDE